MPSKLALHEECAEKNRQALEHLKRAMIAQDYKLDTLLEHFLKAMTVIYKLQIASEGAKTDARRREATIEEIHHRLISIEHGQRAKSQKRHVS